MPSNNNNNDDDANNNDAADGGGWLCGLFKGAERVGQLCSISVRAAMMSIELDVLERTSI